MDQTNRQGKHKGNHYILPAFEQDVSMIASNRIDVVAPVAKHGQSLQSFVVVVAFLLLLKHCYHYTKSPFGGKHQNHPKIDFPKISGRGSI